MKKALLCIVVLAGLLWAGTGYAGMMCWADNIGSYFKTYVTKPDDMSPYKTVTGVWYHPGAYDMPVTGTLQKDLGGTTLRLSLTGTFVNATSEFVVWFFDATLDPTTKDGLMRYLSKKNADSATGSFDLTKTKCSDLPPY